MNKTQLIDELASRFDGNKKMAAQALDAVVDTITRTVAKGEKVGITGFGVFEKVERPARMARNPATGQRVRVAKTSVPRFKAGTGFKDVVSGAKKLPRITAAATSATSAVAGAARKVAAAAKAAAPARATAKKAAPAKKAVAKKVAPAKKAVAKKVAPAKKAVAKKVAPA
ncbi:MAG TPA: HU family DNA-binding protein, partial [Sporichthyaceae bacterium]|nr:HU family DNA-binding protein [Sporichthyaceae bacterium]